MGSGLFCRGFKLDYFSPIKGPDKALGCRRYSGAMSTAYAHFRDFYPFYLGQHSNRTCRRLHFAGSCLVFISFVALAVSGRWAWWFLLPLFGYGFAWIGHFFFEKNRPATFTHPVYSFMGDWVMFRDILFGRIPL
jgi:hypothetical protein